MYGAKRINLFFVKMGQANKWKLLVTTDLSINFQKLMNIYQLRWTIEVFFRECKQFLNLGQSRSTCFDSQIADTTISLVQYSILSFYKKINSQPTFDGVFKDVTEQVYEYNLAQKLQKIFWLIVEAMSQFSGVDVIELTENIFKNDKASEKLTQLNIYLFPDKITDKVA